MKIISNVVDGNLKQNRNLIKDTIKSLEGKKVLITIEKLKKTRSLEQNAYYYGAVLPLVQNGLHDATGQMKTTEQIHYNILLKMFAPENEIVNVETGEFITERLSSSEMTTTQFMEYIMEIQKWAAEFLGIDIPNPNEKTTLQFD